MAFRTKLDYSDNRQLTQRERTSTILSGTTVFGVPFSALTTGPDLSYTAQTSQFFGVSSTYSGNSATTVFTWGIPNVSIIDPYISALTPSNSGVSQNIGAQFAPSSSTTIDGNLVNLTYSGVSAQNLYPITMVEVSPGNYSGSVSTDFFVFSAGTLDFTGRTIWIDNTEILRTKKLIVNDNPQIGYVLTCADVEGMVSWGPVSGATSGTTYWSASTGTNAIVTINAGNLASGNYALAEGFNTTASGDYSHAEGGNTTASGNVSHSEGSGTIASGVISHAEGRLTRAFGDYSHAEGFSTTASGYTSHVEGYLTTAIGLYSHAEGFNTTASGTSSHAEGYITTSSGFYAHSEGFTTISSGIASHSEGGNTLASGTQSHAEGGNTTAIGDYSHAEGILTIAGGAQSHAEGNSTTASGVISHAEGWLTIAFGDYSHAEGYLTIASGYTSHVEGSGTTASGLVSHAEGFGTIAIGDYSHAEGDSTISSGDSSHAEGYLTTSIGRISHVEGLSTTAVGETSHAEGRNTAAIGSFGSHAEGFLTTASGTSSHSEGRTTIAGGTNSHAEGNSTKALGNDSHAEGSSTTASGTNSHAEGNLTIASGDASHSEGNGTTASGTSSHAGGINSIASGLNSFIHSSGSLVTGDRSVVLGGLNITGSTHDTVYVPDLIIDGLTSTDPLATDANGRIVAGVSDIRLKQNVSDLSSALDVIKNLRGVAFEYTEESNMGSGTRFGFIAQEVKDIIPELVRIRPKSDGMLNLNYTEIIPWLVEAIKELTVTNTITNELILETQTIASEDNNIELNYNGDKSTSIGGGISITNGLADGINAEFKLNSDGNWVTNNSIIPSGLVIPNYTPASSVDNYGNLGEVTIDDDYLYIKGNNGWKRLPLELF